MSKNKFGKKVSKLELLCIYNIFLAYLYERTIGYASTKMINPLRVQVGFEPIL